MFLIFTDQGEIGNIHKKKLSYDQHNSPFQNLNSNKKVCVEYNKMAKIHVTRVYRYKCKLRCVILSVSLLVITNENQVYN